MPQFLWLLLIKLCLAQVFGNVYDRDNVNSCERFNGRICNGPEKGVCERGECRCMAGWTGSDCACRDTNETCLAPNGKICTGHGECVCGVCKCRSSEEGTYSGVFCERSSTYPLKCDEFRECVECQIFPYDNDVPAENCNSCIFISIGVDKVEIQKDTEKLCTFYDDKDCRFTFKYEMDDEDVPIVRAKRRKDCPVPGVY
ncbi:integrin beta [Caerostris darwini]|uniref:Integrin beta n=1 Tax=Caerostris darwini TaxID=1538125 RepID=A0AAV4W757_9ARAC|nr:integrin beta [Caerostris darwini]